MKEKEPPQQIQAEDQQRTLAIINTVKKSGLTQNEIDAFLNLIIGVPEKNHDQKDEWA